MTNRRRFLKGAVGAAIATATASAAARPLWMNDGLRLSLEEADPAYSTLASLAVTVTVDGVPTLCVTADEALGRVKEYVPAVKPGDCIELDDDRNPKLRWREGVVRITFDDAKVEFQVREEWARRKAAFS